MTPSYSSSPGDPAELEALWKHRGRMLDIAYRMLGSVTEAEDMADEAFTRLAASDLRDIDDPVGWLVTVTGRLCLDQLRSAESKRRAYVGPWLPEPVLDHHGRSENPADRITLDDSVRMALLVVLEQLSPAERTSYVLHEVFAVPFDDIAAVVGRSPAACRQLASRARRRIQADPEHRRIEVSSEEVEAVARRFAQACALGEIDPLVELLDPAVLGDFDSGGVIPGAPLGPIDGANHVARVLARSFKGQDLSFRTANVNGEPGVIAQRGDDIVVVIALGVRQGRIDLIHAVGNPAKLRGVGRG